MSRLERRINQLSVEIGSENHRIRRSAVSQLYDIAFNPRTPRKPESVWALCQLLNDDDQVVRHLACEAIALIGTPEALTALDEASKRNTGDWAAY